MKPIIGISASFHRQRPEETEPRLSQVALDYLDHRYAEVVRSAGGVPVVLPLLADGGDEEAADLQDQARHLLRSVDGVLLSDDGPPPRSGAGETGRAPAEATSGIRVRRSQRRDRSDRVYVGSAWKSGLPLLAVGRGMQRLVSFFGDDTPAPIDDARVSAHYSGEPPAGASHEITVERDTLLGAILLRTRLKVNSHHRRAVSRAPSGFIPAAAADDGITEAVEAPAHPFAVGVQFRPEYLPGGSPARRDLYGAFVEAAHRRRKGRAKSAPPSTG